jgi:hypothetical protein
MNEEQAVLDFFSRTENLPLALSVTEQIDKLRSEMNSRYWRELHQRIASLATLRDPKWRVAVTEDRNSAGSIVGLYCDPDIPQEVFLRPMLEQQLIGEQYRIYFGLMWSSAPSKEALQLEDVSSLRTLLAKSGLHENANYLGWQWTRLHPRRRDFLLRYARDPDTLLSETESILSLLLVEHVDALNRANHALKSAPRRVAISLDSLQRNRVG